MRRRLACVLLVAVAAAGCGGADSPDERVGAEVEGSGQSQLLADDTFGRAVEDIGVAPATRPPSRLGREIGTRLRALTTDLGRIAPGTFVPGRYRDDLRRRGRLTRARFRARYGEGPLEMCDRTGVLVGQLDLRLDEGADPQPELARGVLEGLRAGDAAEGEAITKVRGRLNDLLPAGEPLECLTKFQASYVFAANLYR